jgi:signal transduction histidine kinase
VVRVRALRSATYLLATGLTGLVTLVVALVLFTVGGLLAVVVAGLPLLAGLALLGVPVAALERRVRRLVDDRPLRHGHRIPPVPGLAPWLRTRFTEAGTWRELGFAALLMTALWPVDLLAVTLGLAVPAGLAVTPVLFAVSADEQVNVLKAWAVVSWPQALLAGAAGVVTAVAAGYGIRLLAGLRSALARLVLEGPAQNVVELTRSRVRLVDAFEAERTRIERDLHDGAQQRLVALSMMLGVARLDAPAGALADQLTRAQEEAGRALAELRDLIRGIHPAVLGDFGLEAALTDLGSRSAVPIEVDFPDLVRFPRPVETAVYFVAAEALSNLARHSGADHGEIAGRYADGVLTMTVTDNGSGGATPGAGTGLLGLADRVAVAGGRLTVSSPVGGPTRVTVEIPCRPL